jgi:biopolymer transport protein ExbD
MARAPKNRLSADIETGSMSDISFLLIIFFILTTTLSKPTGRPVDIPSASPPEQVTKKETDKTPSIQIFADRVMLGMGEADKGREVTIPELKGELFKLQLPAKPEKERMVIVEVADDVVWDRYFKVVTSVAETGGVVALVEGEQ